MTIGIASDEPRAIGKTCHASNFSEVIEIPVMELRPEKYRTLISVDITEPGGQSITTPGAKIVRSAVLHDTTPWIHVTLFDREAPDKET